MKKREMKYFDIKSVSYDVRSTEEGKTFIRGIIPYNSKSEDMGFYEIISPSAFNKSLADGVDVKALLDHSSSKVLGSTRSGTLKLESVDEGLLCECELPNTTYAKDLYEVLKRGDVRTMSFGFSPVKYEDKGNIRTLNEVKLYEVSFGVSFPAYAETNSEVYKRSLLEVAEEITETIHERKEYTEDEISKITKVVEELQNIIAPKIEVRQEAVEEKEPSKPDTSEYDTLALLMDIESVL